MSYIVLFVGCICSLTWAIISLTVEHRKRLKKLRALESLPNPLPKFIAVICGTLVIDFDDGVYTHFNEPAINEILNTFRLKPKEEQLQDIKLLELFSLHLIYAQKGSLQLPKIRDTIEVMKLITEEKYESIRKHQ